MPYAKTLAQIYRALCAMITEAGFKPGEYTRKMIFQSMTKAARKKKSSTPNRSRSWGLLVTSTSVSMTGHRHGGRTPTETTGDPDLLFV